MRCSTEVARRVSRARLFVVLMLGVMLCGFVGSVGRVQAVRMREMSVMAAFMVIPTLVMLCCLSMVMCGLCMMFGRRLVMFTSFVTSMGAHYALLLDRLWTTMASER